MISFLRKIWKLLKQFEFFYMLKYKRIPDYSIAKRRMSKCSIKTKSQISKEMDLLRSYWHCNPVHYVRYGLFEKNLPEDKLLDYIPPYIFYEKELPSLPFKKIPNFDYGKVSLNNLFESRGVPAPFLLAILYKGKFQLQDGQEIELKNILSMIEIGETLFFKPDDGTGGFGIIVAKWLGDDCFEVLGEKINSSQLLTLFRYDEKYVIQKSIIQREDISKINPSCVNTLRVITRYVGDKAEIRCVIMRMGRSKKQVDNSAQGGISIGIDADTGEFYDYATVEHGTSIFETHPDTGYVFKGKRIADWEQIRKEIIDIASKFPEMILVGWDIAISENGVVAIEVNNGFGIDHVQCTIGGARRIFDVYPR